MDHNIHTIPPMPPAKKQVPASYPCLSAAQITSVIEKECGPVQISECHGKGNHTVFFLPEAAQELDMLVSYGRRSPMNALELKFNGYGHICVDSSQKVSLVISHLIPLMTTNRSKIHAGAMNADGSYNHGLDFIEYLYEEYVRFEADRNLDALGFQVDPFLEYGSSRFVLDGHTHPDLGVFFSPPDRENGSARAACDPLATFVCDPIRKKMLAAVGKNLENAKVIVYRRVPTTDAPADDAHDDARVLPPINDAGVELLVATASSVLRSSGLPGSIRCHRTFGRKLALKIRLDIPYTKE